MDLSIKEIVKDNHVFFSHYRAGYLYYFIDVNGETFMFPVPIEDIGDATFNNKDRAMLFMRYIRKSITDNTFVKIV